MDVRRKVGSGVWGRVGGVCGGKAEKGWWPCSVKQAIDTETKYMIICEQATGRIFEGTVSAMSVSGGGIPEFKGQSSKITRLEPNCSFIHSLC